MSKYGYIYKYTYPNGKIYIGQTRVSVKDRHYQHMLSAAKNNNCSVCELAIAKYGKPEVETLETIEVADHENLKLQELLDEAEKKWIKHYDCTTKSGKGYNVQEGGVKITPEEFVLQERWYEIFAKDRWGESIEYVKDLLYSIGNKLCVTKEKLTKEEKAIWFGYKFYEYNIEVGKREITFYSFYMRNDFLCDIGHVPYNILEILNNENSTPEEKRYAEQVRDKIFFDDIIKEAVENNWIEDIRQTIWKQVMKEKDSLLKNFRIKRDKLNNQ